MNLQQLRYVCEIAAQGLNISRAATALDVVQPAISRQVQLLEKEIGATIFVRNRKRIISLSKPGEAILKIARRIVQDIENVRRVGAEHGMPDAGDLTVATNHTYARYLLPPVIERYTRTFPGVRVTLYEGNPGEIGSWLAGGMADLSIATMPRGRQDNLAFLPLETLERVIVVPARHKLLACDPLTLDRIAEYPIITFHPAYPGGENIARAFRVSGITPRFRVRAANVDVIKAYVRQGLGIGIVSRLGVSPVEDRDLRTIDASHLFPSHQILVGLRKGHYLQAHVYEFLKLVAPRIPQSSVQRIAEGGSVATRMPAAAR